MEKIEPSKSKFITGLEELRFMIEKDDAEFKRTMSNTSDDTNVNLKRFKHLKQPPKHIRG